MNRIPRAAGIVLLLPTLAGCLPAMRAAPTEVAAREGYAETQRVVIRSGRLELKARDLEDVKKNIDDLVADVGGWVDSWSLTGKKRLSMTVRVPEPKLDSVMDSISKFGRVVSRTLRSKDVTDQLIDLEARLQNLRALRDRLRAYLDKAANLEEMLAVEKELARVQSQIEAIEGKLKQLRSEISMSELDVYVRRPWLF